MTTNHTVRATVLALSAAMLLSSFPATADEDAVKPMPAIELGAPFVEGAILQRGMQVPIWGWSKPGTKVTVAFAGQRKTAAAGKGGKWMLELDPLVASAEPAELKVAESSGATRTLKNILVGEVWLASGQSNMQWIASKCDVGRVLMKRLNERVAAGQEKAPVIREAKVTNYFASLHPIERAEAEWSADADNFSAIAYAFAYELHRELEVPIGILNCSFSQTSIQAWTPRCGFAAGEDEYTRAIYQKILETDPTTPEHKAAWDKFYAQIEETLRKNADRVRTGEAAMAIPAKTPGNLAGNRDASWLFNARLNPMIPYAIRGGIWNQGYANMGEGLSYYHNLHSMIHGWRTLWGRPALPVYFHQFYSPGQSGETNGPSMGSTAEMRLGTWLARDIPHTGMASQIDIAGAIHYTNKTVPGQRLARHALKNQYPAATLRAGGLAKGLVADGPMFKSYMVEGHQLIVQFEHAEGGLVVAETGSDSKGGLADPTVVPKGDDQVRIFFLADENRAWHPAKLRIDGDRVVLSSSKVRSPRGVSYGTAGIGFQPNLYNRALLPMTPFIYYDHELVTSETWPEESLTIADVVVDPNAVGLKDDWRKMPILSTQFRDNAVLQAGVPITIWGSAIHDYGHEAEGETVIEFSFAGIEKRIPLADGPHIVELAPGQSRFAHGGKEWRVTVPPMEASVEPKTLAVRLLIDGEVAHERVCTNIVIGEVWYVASPQMTLELPAVQPSGGMVRVMTRQAKRSSNPRPSRYSVAVSRTPKNRFASEWRNAGEGLAGILGQWIHAKTGTPVGIVFMQSVVPKGGANPELKSWIAQDCLKEAPSLMNDYKDLAAVIPGNPFYDANVQRYVAAWKRYWSEYVPRMMESKAVPDGAAWGSYPELGSSVTSEAAQTYNVLVHSFTPGRFKGIVFLASPAMVRPDQGANFGEQLSVLANCWKERFGIEDSHFFYTIPGKTLAPKITPPQGIKGRSTGFEIEMKMDPRTGQTQAGESLLKALQSAVDSVYQ